jgi:hypothetical protein
VAGAARPAAAQPWVDWRQARPFHCHANFSLAGLEPLLVELQQLEQQIIELLGLRRATEPIELYLFHDKTSYQAFLESHHPGAPLRRALYIKSGGPGQVFAYRSDELAIDLRHETTHALLHASLPLVPLWLDEGLAEYFEAPAEQRAYDSPHLSNLKWNLRLGLMPKLAALESKHDLSDMGRREYMFAWGWVHFMLHGPADARQELVAYFQELQWATPAAPLSVRLSRRLPGLERRYAQHFRSWSRT